MMAPTADLPTVTELVGWANRAVYYALLGMIFTVFGCCVIGFVWFCKWLVEQLEE